MECSTFDHISPVKIVVSDGKENPSIKFFCSKILRTICRKFLRIPKKVKRSHIFWENALEFIFSPPKNVYFKSSKIFFVFGQSSTLDLLMRKAAWEGEVKEKYSKS